MSLFPFIRSVEEQAIPTPKAYKEYEFNFEAGKLTGRLLEGKEALRMWIYKALLTQRYRYTIYSWDFGQDLDELIGQGYEKGLIKSEVERRIKDCLLVHPHIKECKNFDIKLQQDQLHVNFTVNTTYGEVNINVSNI